MKRGITGSVIAVLLSVALAVPSLWAGDIETQLKQLKSDEPTVRAEAAFELGCG